MKGVKGAKGAKGANVLMLGHLNLGVRREPRSASTIQVVWLSEFNFRASLN